MKKQQPYFTMRRGEWENLTDSQKAAMVKMVQAAVKHYGTKRKARK